MRRQVVLPLHYQNDVVHPDGLIRLGFAEGDAQRESVLAAAERLFAGARAASVPIVHVRVAFRPDHADVIRNGPIWENVARIGAVKEGSWGAAFHERLVPLAAEHVVRHGRVNAFFGSPLEEILRLLDARDLVIAGVATNSTVEHTARHAADMGFHVTVTEDACAASRPGLHHAAIDNIALIGRAVPVDMVVAEWQAA
ncbi:MAG TPA: isochorismatase family cysteine hydrolase [Rhodopila sp.]|nr:isochorismatase family cysteine hydrolase [Rhodopila sp.]